jgi:hypothetical protein
MNQDGGKPSRRGDKKEKEKRRRHSMFCESKKNIVKKQPAYPQAAMILE